MLYLMVINMSEYNNVPKIRFKGFTDVWEQRKFENIFNYERPDKYIVNSTEYLEFGPTPVLTANKAFILGYTTEKNKYVNSHESIIFDDFTLDTKFVDFPYMVKSSAIKILTLKDEKKDNIRFNFELLSNHRFNMLGHARHYISVVQPEEVFTTNKQEQNKIGELFTNLDNLITLHQRKCDNLINVKKSLLEKMFPKNSSNIPEIRFKGFTDVWEQRKLGEVGYAKSGQGFPDAEQGGTRGIPFYKVSDMNITGNENELITANNYVTLEQINKNHWNIINDVPAIFFAKVGAAVMLNRKRLCRKSFLLDNNTMAYMFDKSKWNYNFGKTLFDTIDLTLLAQIGAIPSYNASDVENIEILMPHLKEQEKIGKLFTNLDNLITLHQRKLEKLRNIKKSMLDKMFV